IPLEVGRRPSIAAVDRAAAGSSHLVLVPQRDPERTEPGAGDLAEVGVVAEVLQIARRGPQRYTIVVRTVQRVRMVEVTSGEGDLLIARVEPLTLVEPTSPELGARVRDHLVRILADKSDGSPEKIAADL